MTHTSTEQPDDLQIAAWLRKSNDEAMAWREDGASAIERLHARIAELEAELAAAQLAVQPVAWLAEYVDREGNSAWYVSTHKELAVENDRHGTPRPLYTHPTQQRVELHPNDVIRLAGEVGLNVYRGDGWPDEQLIAKLVKFAAQAKQGEQANG